MSNKSIKISSEYGAGEISPAQRLTEIICEKQAKSQGKTLNPYFWDEPYWNKIFRFQIILVNNLIKKYSYQSIFKALASKEARRVYSFGAKFFIEIVERMFIQETLQEKLLETSIQPVNNNPSEIPREVFRSKNNKSVRSKLDN